MIKVRHFVAASLAMYYVYAFTPESSQRQYGAEALIARIDLWQSLTTWAFSDFITRPFWLFYFCDVSFVQPQHPLPKHPYSRSINAPLSSVQINFSSLLNFLEDYSIFPSLTS